MSNVTEEIHSKLNLLVNERDNLIEAINKTTKSLMTAKLELKDLKKDIKKHKMHKENFRESCVECGFVSKIY